MWFYFSFWWSHIEKCWRLYLEAYSRMGWGNSIPYIPMTMIPEKDCWDGRMHNFYDCVRNCMLCSDIKSRSVLMSWVIFGMRGPFLCPSAIKTATEGAADQRKAPLFGYVAVIWKKGTFATPRTFPQGPLSTMVYQALNQNAPPPPLQGPAWLQTQWALF